MKALLKPFGIQRLLMIGVAYIRIPLAEVYVIGKVKTWRIERNTDFTNMDEAPTPEKSFAFKNRF
ncbi:MAG: hypothetical protein PHG00_14535 [Methylococcales bacterium]|nr:hypothetical protein [Methylococcales bacterium]